MGIFDAIDTKEADSGVKPVLLKKGKAEEPAVLISDKAYTEKTYPVGSVVAVILAGQFHLTLSCCFRGSCPQSASPISSWLQEVSLAITATRSCLPRSNGWPTCSHLRAPNNLFLFIYLLSALLSYTCIILAAHETISCSASAFRALCRPASLPTTRLV